MTLNLRFIVKNQFILAGSSSVIATIVMTIILYSILARLEDDLSIIAIIVYALGVGTGTVLGMKLKLKR